MAVFFDHRFCRLRPSMFWVERRGLGTGATVERFD